MSGAARPFYQSTSRELIEFLRDANVTDGLGSSSGAIAKNNSRTAFERAGLTDGGAA